MGAEEVGGNGRVTTFPEFNNVVRSTSRYFPNPPRQNQFKSGSDNNNKSSNHEYKNDDDDDEFEDEDIVNINAAISEYRNNIAASKQIQGIVAFRGKALIPGKISIIKAKGNNLVCNYCWKKDEYVQCEIPSYCFV